MLYRAGHNPGLKSDQSRWTRKWGKTGPHSLKEIITSNKAKTGESIDGRTGVQRSEKHHSNQGDVEHKVAALADVRVVVIMSDVPVSN